MATDSIVGGLFGITPEMYQQSKAEQALSEGAQLGQMSPDAFGRSMLYAGSAQLGRGIGGALGGVDPQLQLISARNALAQQFDTSTSAGLVGLANALRERNDVAGATQVAQAAMAAKQKEAELAVRGREHLSTEQKNALGLADASFERGTPEWNKKYSEELTRLTTAAKSGANIKEVGVAASSREPVYFDTSTDTQFIMKQDPTGKQIRVPYNGGVDKTTARTTVSVTNKGEEAFVKQLGELDAKRVENASTLRDSAIGELNSLSRMQNLNQNELVSGSFASNRVGALNLLDTLGMTGVKDKAALANSQQFDKVTGDLILDKIKKLGSNPSNADREFTKNIVPQLASSPVARQELINYLSKKANEVVDETTRLETYARKNKGLEEFTYKVPLVNSGQTPKSGLESMSTEQLQQMLKNAK
jgi:hypothetical protein